MTKQSFSISEDSLKKNKKQQPQTKIQNPMTYSYEVTLIWADMAYRKSECQVNLGWLFSRDLEV